MVDYKKYSKKRVQERKLKKEAKERFQKVLEEFMEVVYKQTRMRRD